MAQSKWVGRQSVWGISALFLTLTACGAGPEGVLAPIPANLVSSAASDVTMLVATSRKPSGDPATLFTGERSPTLSMTDLTISIPPKRAPGTVEWPKTLPPNPERDFAVVAVKNLSIPEAHKWLHSHNSNGHVLVFVHGFNNRYEDSVFRFAQFVHDSRARVAPILFTWPSRASVLGYNYDKESTNFSRTAFERTLKALADDRSVTDITLMAHSMGTWLAMESLRQMALEDGQVSPKIRNVILASPDLDVDVFGRQWTELGPKKPKFTITVSRDDRALAVSRLIAGNVDRVGQADPSKEPYKSKLEAAGITVLDLTDVKTDDRLNHSKFAESPEIVQLLGAQLGSGQIMTDSRVGLGDKLGLMVAGTVDTVGNAAAATVSGTVTTVEGKAGKPRPDELETILKGDATTE
ncbi:alpha/beta fold hydrolase [Mesorhizobium sp. WSM4307]|uniref:alpha/beta hydrolase n=1 Tax=unclassified Mesorhizobium TaxID=325217 RepID=UPI00115CB196|nr:MULTISPECIES: alpha/beta hydrolase [unclassified Mesorhizobium]TRC73959.1 alpha/beta fold hydrolase [Mesorhizobium sp. WSM4310]TRC75996.1 alpha/beta fold hydrolase [Mesorhizobium sp. WSM4315]TRC84249.1 alpha/beta fold hydrolase [Mesorhizobium sp. WSM4307]